MAVTPIFNPPIFRLNEDLLWSICNINADIFADPDALRTTRLTSQVCRAWRDLMLATSSLWGSLIDLDDLSNASDDWRCELIQRSGSALLRVKADRVITESDSLVPFLLDIVDKHWRRIERLVICISLNAFRVNINNWDRLYLPAPHLQIFKFHISLPNESELPDNIWSSRSLFDNNAPALREFYATQYRFTLQTNWMTNLSSLRIGYPFALQEVLFTLQNTPNLSELHVDSLFRITTDTPGFLSPVQLHKLERCKLQSDFKSCIALLQHLNAPSSCSLIFSPGVFEDDFNTKESEDFLKTSFKVLSDFARSYFRHHESNQVVKLSLLYSSKLFLLAEDDLPFHLPKFSILFHIKPAFPPYLPSFIFKELTFSHFSQATDFRVNLHGSVPIEILIPFLSRFSSVKRLKTWSKDTLLNLCDLYSDIEDRGDSTTIFPNLDTIALDVSFRHRPLPDLSPFSKDGHLHELLKFRRKYGCPIRLLDLTKCHGEFMPCLDYLEEMSGLRVLWTERVDQQVLEYECGSGHPEKLPYPQLNW